MLVHMWDGQECYGGQNSPDGFSCGTSMWDGSTPWQMCIERCTTQGATLHGRLSTMIMYQGLRDRRDRTEIPLPFGDRGGIILRNSRVQIDCLYGIDGGTYRLDDYERPGCNRQMCDPTPEGIAAYRHGGLCGFDNQPALAWPTSALKHLLELHAEHGAVYHGRPEFHAGYNEVIVNSQSVNSALPDAIEAFFFIKDHETDRHGVPDQARAAHRAFLRAYPGARDTPLLSFDYKNWEAPFSMAE